MYLLDTHIFIWYLIDSPRLSRDAKEVINLPANQILVSAASAWEISTKYRLGKLPEAGLLAANIEHYITQCYFRELTINTKHAQLAGEFKFDHKDPFDRMLLAQSIIENLTLITTDSVFSQLSIGKYSLKML